MERGSGAECLFLILLIFHEGFLFTPGFFPENEEISSPPPCAFLIGIYLFYENWSTETFRRKESKKWDANQYNLKVADFSLKGDNKVTERASALSATIRHTFVGSYCLLCHRFPLSRTIP